MRHALLVVALLVAAAPALAQETCPDGRALSGDLGIDRYLCAGGSCSIWIHAGGGLAHSFTVEPRVARITSGSPADGRLEVGDALVAIDDLLLTTAAAGRRLARLEPGVPVRLWFRRDGRDHRITLTPVPGCGPSGLSVRIPGAS